MANYKTGAQRYNDRMFNIFEEAKRLKKDPQVKSFKRHQVKIGKAHKDKGDQYPGSKARALEKHKEHMPKDRNHMVGEKWYQDN